MIFGHARMSHNGQPPRRGKSCGFSGAGVLEILEDDASGTYCAVYAVRFREAVFGGSCTAVQKKSKCGIATPKDDIEIVRARLKVAETLAKGSYEMEKRVIDGIEIEVGSGNVFADLGLPDAEKLKIKSGLVFEITEGHPARLGLTQEQAARRMGIAQPEGVGLTAAVISPICPSAS